MPMPRALIEGSIAGTLFGIYIKTGVSVDEGDVITNAATQVFEALEKISDVTYNWRAGLLLISMMFTFTSVIDLLIILRKEENIQTGILLYGTGFFSGLCLMWIA
jgi:hypothetical protein